MLLVQLLKVHSKYHFNCIHWRDLGLFIVRSPKTYLLVFLQAVLKEYQLVLRTLVKDFLKIMVLLLAVLVAVKNPGGIIQDTILVLHLLAFMIVLKNTYPKKGKCLLISIQDNTLVFPLVSFKKE